MVGVEVAGWYTYSHFSNRWNSMPAKMKQLISSRHPLRSVVIPWIGSTYVIQMVRADGKWRNVELKIANSVDAISGNALRHGALKIYNRPTRLLHNELGICKIFSLYCDEHDTGGIRRDSKPLLSKDSLS